MNYRQWKKEYKKQHGVNPPFEEDKRQRIKLLRKKLLRKNILQTAMRTNIDSIQAAFERINKAFAQIIKDISAGLERAANATQKIAEQLESEATNDGSRND